MSPPPAAIPARSIILSDGSYGRTWAGRHVSEEISVLSGLQKKVMGKNIKSWKNFEKSTDHLCGLITQPFLAGFF